MLAKRRRLVGGLVSPKVYLNGAFALVDGVVAIVVSSGGRVGQGLLLAFVSGAALAAAVFSFQDRR